MSCRSHANMRPIFSRAGLWLLLLVLVLPRCTVHSHAAIGNAIGSAAFLRHVQLLHTSLDREIPVDQLHVHWCLGGCDVLLTSASDHDVRLTVDHLWLGSAPVFDSWISTLPDAFAIGSSNGSPSLAGYDLDAKQPDRRICFGVWTC